MRTLILLIMLILLETTCWADDSEHFVKQVKLRTGQVLVVAEGDLEPRSVGSFSVRLYSGQQPEYPTDDFITGIVLPRDGGIIKVTLQDINGDKKQDLVVVSESAGSGSYLSAKAFLIQEKSIKVISSIEGLSPKANVMNELVKAKQH